jgi:PAS domain S-box-containing protein
LEVTAPISYLPKGILNTSQFYLLITDIKGNVQYLNSLLSSYLRITPENYSEITTDGIFSPEEWNKINDRIIELENGEATLFTETLKINNLSFQWEISLLTSPDQTSGLLFLGTLSEFDKTITVLDNSSTETNLNTYGFEYTFEQSPIGIAFFFPDGSWKKVNPKFCEISGYTKEELKSLHWTDLLMPKYLEDAQNLWHQLIHQEIPQHTAEIPLKGKNEDNKWCTLHFFPVFNSENQLLFLVTYIEDVSLRKNISNQLQRSQFLLNNLGKNTSIGDWQYDITTNTLEWTDEIFYIHELPLSATPTMEESLTYFANEDQDIVKNAIQELITKGAPLDLKVKLITGNGNIRWVHILGNLIVENHNSPRIMGSIQNITHIQEQEELISQLSLIARKTSNLIILTDKHRKIIWVNEAYTKLTGYTIEEVLGRNPSFLQSSGTDPKTIETLRNKLNNAEPYRCELLNQGKSGNTYWLDLDIQPLFNANNELNGFLGIETDITQQKAVMQLLTEQNEKFKEIAFLQSHVLRRPISSIIGLCYLINLENERKLDFEKIIEYVNHLNIAANETDQVIRNIMDKVNYISNLSVDSTAQKSIES